MEHIECGTLGEAWLTILARVREAGVEVGGETLELCGVSTTIEEVSDLDPLLTRLANREHITSMRKVFFSREPNAFGHSYHDAMTGPEGRRDLTDVAKMLRSNPKTKRAVVTLVPVAGKIPCINLVHFLCREGRLETMYFARGQDVFNKFYADALCVHDMAANVAASTGISVGRMTGVINSAHVYLLDLPLISDVLARAMRSPLAQPSVA